MSPDLSSLDRAHEIILECVDGIVQLYAWIRRQNPDEPNPWSPEPHGFLANIRWGELCERADPLLHVFNELKTCYPQAARDLTSAFERLPPEEPVSICGFEEGLAHDIAYELARRMHDAFVCLIEDIRPRQLGHHEFADYFHRTVFPAAFPNGKCLDELDKLRLRLKLEYKRATDVLQAQAAQQSAAGEDGGSVQRPDRPADRAIASEGGSPGTVSARKEPSSQGAQAGDDSAWVLPSKVYPGQFDTYKQFTAFLDEHQEIRRRKPSPQRLEVHHGDWVNYWAKGDNATFDALEHADIPVDEETVSAFVDGAAERQAKIREEKARK